MEKFYQFLDGHTLALEVTRIPIHRSVIVVVRFEARLRYRGTRIMRGLNKESREVEFYNPSGANNGIMQVTGEGHDWESAAQDLAQKVRNRTTHIPIEGKPYILQFDFRECEIPEKQSA